MQTENYSRMVGRYLGAFVACLTAGMLTIPGIAGARPMALLDESRAPARSLVDELRRGVMRMPNAPRVLEALERAKATKVDRVLIAWPEWDVSGDGRRDILALAYEQDVGSGSTDMTVRFLEGDTGKTLSTYRHHSRGDDFCFPVTARVGTAGGRGMYVFCLSGFFSSSLAQLRWRVIAVSGNGRKLWSRTFAGKGSNAGDVAVVKDAPISLGTLDALKGRATDLVIGLFDGAIAFRQSVNSTRVVVVDGRTGAVREHPESFVGVDAIPYPTAVSDYSGDHKDDYVVMTRGPFVEREPVGDPAGLAWKADMRSGKSGSAVWDSSPMQVRGEHTPELWPSGNLRGSRHRELFLTVARKVGSVTQPLDYFLIDGKRGLVADRQTGVGFPEAVGDIDRDGDNDVVGQRFLEGKGWIAIRWSGLDAQGFRLYRKKVVERGPHQPVSRTYFYLSGGTGWDVEPDGVGDDVAAFWMHGADLLSEKTVYRIVSMRKARTVARGDHHLTPLFGAVDARGADIVRGAYEAPGFALDVRRGATDRRLWKVRVSSLEPFTGRNSYTWATAARFDRDRCADVLTQTVGKTGSWLALLDGGSGRPLWKRSFFGPPAGLDVSVGEDRNPVC